jgi:4-amino-4-deoxy-L-arabinose transferase-like glycosyltransferase
MVYKKPIKFPLLLVLFLVLIFLFRIPSFFEPYWYGDEGIYLTLGQALRKGLVFYRDIYDNKPPFLYLMAAISGSVFWFRMITAFWNLLNIVLVYLLAALIFERKSAAVWVVTLLFGFLTTFPWLEGNIANGEIFMIMPVCAGFTLLWNILMKGGGKEKIKKRQALDFFLVGVLFSVGILFKVPAGFDFLAVLLFLLLVIKKYNPKNLVLLVRQLFYLLLGLTVPVLLTAVYYGLMGTLKEYVVAAFLQNLGYLSSWSGGQRLPLWQKEIFWRGIILMGILGAIWIKAKKISKSFLLICLWFLMALFGSFLSGRPYPHYLLQVVAPFCFLAGFLLIKLKKTEVLFLGLSLFLVFFSIFYYKFYFYATVPYYKNFLDFALGIKSKEKYYEYFGGEVVKNYRLAKFIRERTGDDERIFIWGDSPILYALSRRLPAGRYTAAYHISDFGGYKETMESLRRVGPKYIVWMNSEKKPFEELMGFLRAGYVKLEPMGGGVVYRRIK